MQKLVTCSLLVVALGGCEAERRTVDLAGGTCESDLGCLLVESGGDSSCGASAPCPSSQACVWVPYGFNGAEGRCVNLKPAEAPCPEGTLEKNAAGADGVVVNAIVCVGDTGTTCEDGVCLEALDEG